MQTNLKNSRLELSIIIVNFNTKDLLDQCLNSLYATIKEHKFEVIVVDNNSSDKSVEMIKNKYQEIYLIENKENVGFAQASNQGIKVSKGDYFLLLNPDTAVSQESIDKMMYFIQSTPKIGLVGPKVLNKDGTVQPVSCGSFPTLSRVFLWQTGLRLDKKWDGSNPWYLSPDGTEEVDWISGVCMLIKREVFEQAGYMDEDFFSYFEDVDFCYRVKQKGWGVYYFDNAEIIHLLGQSWRSIGSVRSVRVKLESELLFFCKYFGKISAFLVILLTIYGSLLRLFIWKLIRDIKKNADIKILEHKAILRTCFSRL